MGKLGLLGIQKDEVAKNRREWCELYYIIVFIYSTCIPEVLLKDWSHIIKSKRYIIWVLDELNITLCEFWKNSKVWFLKNSLLFFVNSWRIQNRSSWRTQYYSMWISKEFHSVVPKELNIFLFEFLKNSKALIYEGLLGELILLFKFIA